MKRKKKKMSKKQFAETMAQELNRYFEETLTMEVHATIREFVKTNDYTHYAIVLERPGVYALPALNVDFFYEGYKLGDSTCLECDGSDYDTAAGERHGRYPEEGFWREVICAGGEQAPK